jgi:hypothetical protein
MSGVGFYMGIARRIDRIGCRCCRHWTPTTGSQGGRRRGDRAEYLSTSYMRVCGWRAKHAVSLGHLDCRPFWLG